MNYKNLLFQVDGGIAIITFNRPAALNAMNPETIKELTDAADVCKNSDEIKVLILTGSGEKAFVAGADIAALQKMRPQEALTFIECGQEAFRAIETLSKPSIAAINGLALGGGLEISMACDIRYASESARFGQPEILIGMIPGWGGTQRLARLIGMGRAKEIILSGDAIDAKRAYEIGLINKIFPRDQLLLEARKMAVKLRDLPAFALQMAKDAINFGYDLSLDNANRLEAACCAQCFSTDDQKEGMKAFLDKRKPVFKGR